MDRMKVVWNSFLTAFTMFSKIPVPRADWTKENMKYMVCFFPGVGAVAGLLVWIYGRICEAAGFGSLMRAAGLVLIPVLVSGGIHLDGYLDTMDALSSYQPRERKLEILKDSNAGAFAVIMGCVWFVLALGVWSEIGAASLPVAALGCIVSRALSGIALAAFPCANKKGSLSMFADAAAKRVVYVVLAGWLVLAAVLGCMTDWKLTLLMFLAAGAVYIYYYHMAMKEFGGTTGDIAGFFLECCELAIALAVMLGGKFL